jgi:uncharacterized protein YjbJ (UPF0337 family)
VNKDQVKGSVKDIAGKAQKQIGKLTDDKEQQAKASENRLPEKRRRNSVMPRKSLRTQ